ncbi:MAG: adenylosuccinate lyase [Firmicutes bacterium]|nr:adenylosuccinate lyase [Bacillota bacterium]
MASNIIDSQLFKDLFGNEAMREVFSDRSLIQKWLDVEAALARAEARLGMIPADAAQEITKKAKVENISLSEMKALIEETVHPFVPAIRCLAKICSEEAARYIHWGATTQDIMDTAVVLQVRDAFGLIKDELAQLKDSLAKQVRRYSGLPMAGRTHSQHAVPITLGYKLAVWLDELSRHQDRLEDLEERLLVGQFSGAAGTLASLGERGMEVQEYLMEELGLGVPPISWHTARDRFVEYTMVLSMISGTLHKIANEVVNLQKTELSELEEPFHEGKVGSSTMPHKRNPMISEIVCTLGLLVREIAPTAIASMVHEHERDMRPWATEWEYLPRISIYTHMMLVHTNFIISGLMVHEERMRENMDLLGGLMLSEKMMLVLAERLGRQEAHEVMYKVCIESFEKRIPLAQVLESHSEIASSLSREELEELLRPESYLGLAQEFAQRVLAGVDPKQKRRVS